MWLCVFACVARDPATFTFILILCNLLMDNHLSPFPLDIPVFFGGKSSSILFILFIRWRGFFNSLFYFSISSIFFFPADGITAIFFWKPKFFWKPFFKKRIHSSLIRFASFFLSFHPFRVVLFIVFNPFRVVFFIVFLSVLCRFFINRFLSGFYLGGSSPFLCLYFLFSSVFFVGSLHFSFFLLFFSSFFLFLLSSFSSFFFFFYLRSSFIYIILYFHLSYFCEMFPWC